MEPVQVRVGIKNQGDAAARPSTIDLFFQDSARHHYEKKIRVPKLGPHTHPHYAIVDITGAKPTLGFAQLGAVADFANKVKESDETNNLFKGERFVIIARQWNVADLETSVTMAGAAQRTTMAAPGFHFEFSNYDHAAEQYVYAPVGPVTSTVTYSGFCSGTGSLTVTHSPWSGFLHIAGDFRTYDAFVQADPTKYLVTVACLGGFSSTETASFDDLDTSAVEGMSHTSEKATSVAGDASDASTGTEWRWQFQAAIP
jgi:hypothetical protein